MNCRICILLILLLILTTTISGQRQLYYSYKKSAEAATRTTTIPIPIPTPPNTISPPSSNVQSKSTSLPLPSSPPRINNNNKPTVISIDSYDDEYIKKVEFLNSFKRKSSPSSSSSSSTTPIQIKKLTRQSIRAQELLELRQLNSNYNNKNNKINSFNKKEDKVIESLNQNFTRVLYSYWNSSVYCRPSCYFFDAKNWNNHSAPRAGYNNYAYVSVDMSWLSVTTLNSLTSTGLSMPITSQSVTLPLVSLRPE
ncbi:hypothetical protein PPL_06575 [Heterostelium album PN500]|uniref:Uncharacterized protein n=1 Tax=Heterostelium pallidum (strain ATCC 26659 / Pp 5 / PN500) TaxID=670386 RepID=D3BDJ2_HETP5|nr:hypothetical protein PPL_06575 [Heterostelium album PN500]EFA80537.1 hypothetical protein PPL_06575 [Heterostelium album PN500]|eukprot:XP_020432657.1 hypothetical protein PPL_06575 [Heterostelium album PN500]